jgi:hypothetical protein
LAASQRAGLVSGFQIIWQLFFKMNQFAIRIDSFQNQPEPFGYIVVVKLHTNAAPRLV